MANESKSNKLGLPALDGTFSTTPGTHFDVFGITPAFAIDVSSVRTLWLKLSRTHHPDRLSGSGEEMGRINEAYQVLSHEQSRRDYLLDEVIGGSLRAACGRLKTQIPMELAGRWFEIQEMIEDQDPGAQSELTEFRAQVSERIESLRQKRSQLEKHWDLSHGDHSAQSTGAELISIRGELTTLESLLRDIGSRIQ
jgi:curved DNA-binding protein CbpA